MQKTPARIKRAEASLFTQIKPTKINLSLFWQVEGYRR